MAAVIDFFNNVFDYKYFILGIGCLFLAIYAVCAALMATLSNLAKVQRGQKKALKFFRWNTVLFENNKDLFYKKVVRALPHKARRQWRTASKYYDDYCSVGFRNILAECLRTGGNTTFVCYVSAFIVGLIAVIVTAMLMGGNTGEYAPMMSFTIAGGAGAMLLLATELYYLDKRADKRGEEFISTVSSRLLRNAESETVEEMPFDSGFYKAFKPSNSVSLGMNGAIAARDLNIKSHNKEAHEDCTNDFNDDAFEVDFDEIFTDTENEENVNGGEVVFNAASDDNTFENTEIIEKCPAFDENKSAQCPRKEFDLPIAGVRDKFNCDAADSCEQIDMKTEIDSVKEPYIRGASGALNDINVNARVECLVNAKAEDFDALNRLMDYEERLNVMQNSNVIAKDNKDSLSKLEDLINGIVSDGASDALLRDVYGALNEIDKYDYNNPIDKIRVKCLIRRLENAI